MTAALDGSEPLVGASIGWRDIREGGLRLDEVEAALGIDVRVAGHEHWALCPLPTHDGDRSSAHWSINDETFEWHCFTCGQGGKLPLLVQYVLGLDREQALNWLAEYSDVSPNQPVENWVRKFRNMAAADRHATFESKPTLMWLPEWKIEPYEEAFADDTAVWEWVNDKWGLEPETMFKFRLGYCANYEHKKSFKGEALIVPHFFDSKLVGWQARWLDTPYSLKTMEEATKFPKYVNTDDFPKAHTLYNWDRVKGGTVPLLVVESFATVMKLDQCDYPAVATFGANISQEQEELLSRYRGPLFLAGDNDAAGQSAVRSMIDRLKLRQRIWTVPPPDAEKGDMGDLDKPEIDALIERAVPHFLPRTSP